MNRNQATWKAKVPGVGFNYSCAKSTVPFDMVPYNTSANYSNSILGLNLRWNHSDPNTIYLDTYWKDTTSCTGAYKVRNCTLKTATVEYPVQVELNVSKTLAGPYYSLQPATNRGDDKVLRILHPYPEEGHGNTTYGGIWYLFEQWYRGSIQILNYTAGNSGRIGMNGPFANTLAPNFGHHLWREYRYVCNMSVIWGFQTLGYFQAFNAPKEVKRAESGWCWWSNNSADVADVVLKHVRQSMFLACV